MKIRTLAAAGLLAVGTVTVPVVTLTGGTPASAHVTEDSAHWNCRTMGNHRCGHPLPRYVHWRYSTRAEAADCATHKRPAITEWVTGGTTYTVFCTDDGSSYSN